MQNRYVPLTILLTLLSLVRAQSPSNRVPTSEQYGELWRNALSRVGIEDASLPGQVRSLSGQGALTIPNGLVSVTSLAAPREARKAYERANREMGRNKPDMAKAAVFLETAVTLYPSFAAAWYFMGGIRLALNDADGARRAFEAALSADPRFPYAYLPLASMELRARHYAEAAKLAESALRLDYKLMDAHYYRALANTVLRRHDVARQSIETILDSRNDHRYPAVHAMLAVILVTQSNFEAAANEYRKFLDLDPGSPAAAAARDFLSKWHPDGEVP